MLKLGDKARRSLLFAIAACGVLVALGLVAMVVLPAVIPAKELRRAAVQAVTGTTGQTVKISGDPVLRIFPSPRLSLGKVEFPLPQGQSLDAESVVARLNIWPLMFGKLDVADVSLNRPTLVLTGSNVVPAIALAPFLADKDLPELRVVDGTIAWRDVSGLTRELVSGLIGRLDRILDGKGVAVAVNFEWRDEPVVVNLMMDDTPAFMAGTLTPTRISLSNDTSRASFRGLTALGKSFTAKGNLTGESTSLRNFITWIGGSPPTPGGLASFDLSAKVKVKDGEFDLSDTQIDLDGNRTDGALLLKLAGDRPLVQGTFASERLDLTPYGRLRFTGRNGRDWDIRSIDVSFLKDFDVDLRLSAGEVTMDTSRFTTVATSAVLTDGRLALSLGQATAWGGMLRGSAVLAPRAPGPSGHRRLGAFVRVEAEGTDVALDTALGDIAGFRRLEGVGDLSLHLEGEGRSIQDIAEDISGSISLTSHDGALLGFDVSQVLHRIERRPLSAGDPRGGRTAFTGLDTKITLKDGTADIEQMSLEGKRVRLALSGTASVGVRDLDLKGVAALVAPAQDGDTPMELPFIVQGPWDSPLVIADPQSLLQRSGAAQPLLEAVRNRPSAVGAVRQIIDSLTRSSEPAPPQATTPAN